MFLFGNFLFHSDKYWWNVIDIKCSTLGTIQVPHIVGKGTWPRAITREKGEIHQWILIHTLQQVWQGLATTHIIMHQLELPPKTVTPLTPMWHGSCRNSPTIYLTEILGTNPSAASNEFINRQIKLSRPPSYHLAYSRGGIDGVDPWS